MGEKAVVVHKAVIMEWSRRSSPPLALSLINSALHRIDEVIRTTPPEDVVIVEEPPSTGFTSLPDRVGKGNSARLYGALAGYCLRLARTVLEDAGISVTLDNKGSLP